MTKIIAENVFIGDTTRAEVEAYITAVFKDAYNANITHFMPQLVALRDESGTLLAAFGVRHAARETLFLEQYFDTPIEALLQQKLGITVPRQDIICIGNLAVNHLRNAPMLIREVIAYSLNNGIKWCVATAHKSLQNGLAKGGRDIYPLIDAYKSRLPVNEQKTWGTYYDKTPQVVAIRGVATNIVKTI